MTGFYSSLEVAAHTGVSLRQLQWWDEARVLIPRRYRNRRIYSIDDLLEIWCIGQLRGRGLSLQRIRRILRFLRSHLAVRLQDGAGCCWIVTDGHDIHIEIHQERVIEILERSRVPMFVIRVQGDTPKKGRK